MPLIVLEGADGCGKTTLAQTLMEQDSNARYFHATYRFKDRMTLYHYAYLNRAIKHLKEGRTVILDRWWPSEYVYGTVYRGKHEPAENLRMLHRLGLRYGVVYVWCRRNNVSSQMEAFKAMKASREEMYDYDERIGFLHDGYEDLWRASTPGQESRWLQYNVDAAIANRSYFEEVVKLITNCANWYNRVAKQAEKNLPHSSGNPTAPYVMVGECLNKYPWVNVKGRASLITTALRTLKKPEHSFFWTATVGGKDHEEQLARFISSAGKTRRIIAMGDYARELCEHAGKCDYAIPDVGNVTQEQLVSILEQVL